MTSPDGEVWRVRVLWRPRHRSLYRRFRDWRRDRGPDAADGMDAPGADGCFDDLLVAVAVIAVLVTLGAFLWWVVIPAVLLLIDALLLLLLFLGAIAGRFLLRRPWTVEARSSDVVHHESVVGFGNARGMRDELARRISTGDTPGGHGTR